MQPGPNRLWFSSLAKRGIRLGLDSEEELLTRLGRPQDGVRFVHVAGTDGKGSICAMIESVLLESGLRAGAFTSPEILEVNECIRVGGSEVSDDGLERLLGRVRAEADAMASEGRPCTSFEVLTAAALLHFREESAEVAVVEVGMGGRLDSTNVISPEVSIISNIGMEHIAFLGSTIREIAAEKAGIMKRGVPCVTMNSDEVCEVLEGRARAVGCPLSRLDAADVRILSNGEDSVEMEYRGCAYRVGLPGRHQARNAALAVEGLSLLRGFGERIAPHVRDGLRKVSWPCRMQRLEGTRLVLDVTHTVEGAACLRSDVAEIYGSATVVFGVLSDKDADGLAREIAPIASRMIVTEPDSPRARPAGETAEAVSRHARVDAVYGTVGEAMEAAMRGEGTVLVTGSFRMAEGALRWLRTRSSRSWTSCRASTGAARTPGAAPRG